MASRCPDVILGTMNPLALAVRSKMAEASGEAVPMRLGSGGCKQQGKYNQVVFHVI